jgi:deazaflavin-dependent oxidoreductase (nitroreductase family)
VTEPTNDRRSFPWDDDRCFEYGEARPLHRAVRALGAHRPVSRVLARVLHHLDRPVSRLTGGGHTLTSRLTGLTVAMLTTTGARSGLPRPVPVLGFPAEGGLAVVASNFGQDHHPAWYHNLLAHPRAEVLVRHESVDVVAALTEGEQRERIWATAVTLYPGWAVYRERAAPREIGVFLLTPASG